MMNDLIYSNEPDTFEVLHASSVQSQEGEADATLCGETSVGVISPAEPWLPLNADAWPAPSITKLDNGLDGAFGKQSVFTSHLGPLPPSQAPIQGLLDSAGQSCEPSSYPNDEDAEVSLR